MDKRYYYQPIETVLQELEVNRYKGLSKQEVVERQKIYGENTFTPPKEKSMLQEMKEILTQQLIVILLIAAGISLLIKEYHDAIGICLAVFIGSAIGLLTESKSKKAADALARMSEDIYVKVLREGKIEKIHKSELVVGDIVYLESGDSVPADGRILQSTDFKVREDMLTGESDDVKKRAGIVKEEKITREGEEVLQEPVPAKQYNMVFGGTLVACGQAVIIITATGDATQMGNIAKELSEKEADTPLQLKLDNLGKGISKVSTGVASFLFLYMLRQILQGASIEWNLQGDLFTEQTLQQLITCFPEIKTAFVVCVALIVAAVPEGLPTMINITLSITMKKMASIHALVRKKEACETIGAVSVICSDKTGTLTQNCMKVEGIYLQGKEIEKQRVRNYSAFFHNCIINSTAIVEQTRGEESYIGSATECALLALCKEKDCRKFRQTQKILRQIPFQSEKKYMLTIIEEEGKYSIYSKGAPEVILMQCGYEEIDGVVKVLTSERKKSILEEIARLQEQAMRVLAFAHQKVKVNRNYLEKEEWKEELTFTGFVGIRDPLREGVKEAIHIAKQGGIETKMLTGDNIHTAVAIGKELGMIRKGMRAVEASYIELLTDKELEKELSSIAIVARSKPETKMRIVQALQRKGEIVAVTGDGINDAPALAKADVGIAMGVAGTEVSKNAADIILTDDSFNTIVDAIEWGRGIYNNFQRFIQFQLTVNIIAFVIAIISQLAGYRMPFSTIHLLWINMIMDGPPALALGLEPIRSSVMERKPIPREVPIINSYMVRTIAINSSVIIGLLYLQIKYNLLGASNDVIGAASQKQTVLFSLFAFSVLFNAFNCREFGTGSIFPNFFKNKLVIKIIFITALLQILITQYGGAFFQAVPLSFVMWSKIIGLSSIIIWMNELVKWSLRSMKKSAKKVIRHVRLLN